MAPAPVLIDYLRTVLALGMLGYAAYKDLKTREIYDTVWVIPAAIGLIIDVYEVYVGYLTLTQAGISIGFMVILSGVLWFLQLFGEADLIAFVALAIIHPRTPDFGFIGYTPLLFTFTLVANSALSGLLTAFYSLFLNLKVGSSGIDLFERHEKVSSLKKLGLLFTGQYMKTKEVKGPPFEYPLEVRGEVILKPDIWDDDKAKNDFRIAREKGFDRVWVSATLPYIVNLLVGYVIAVVYGDILFSIMSRMV
jgi:hypothetical protein